jgi:ADP-ribose pyrophosphatase
MIHPFDDLIPEFRPAGPTEASSGGVGRIGREEIHSGRIVRLSVDTVRFPGGGTGELEFIRHRGAAAVLPFLDAPTDPDPRILVVRQYRYAAGGHLYEIPAGMPEGDYEPWEVCARRELAEETGYRTGQLRYLSRIFTTPGFTDEVIHLFAAADLKEGEVDRDDDEFIQVGSLRLSRALEGVRTGIIVDAKTVSTLLFAGQFLPGAWEGGPEAPPRSSAGA